MKTQLKIYSSNRLRPVGIVGYGAYVPRYRLPATEVARVWTGGQGACRSKRKPCRVWMKT